MRRSYLSVAVLSLTATPAFAAVDQFLIHPDLAGWNIGVDGYLGTGDDFVFAGSNTLGAASQFIGSNGVYGYFGGSMEIYGIGPFGRSAQKYFGANTHGFISNFGEWNLNSSSIFNEFFTQSLNLSVPSVITINPDQTYTTSFRLNDGVSGGTLQLTGTGVYLGRTQDPASLYSGDQLAHFQTVIPFLPDDWLGVAHEFQTWEVLDGPFAGTTGFTSTTFFTTDPESIPETLTPLGPPWITTGATFSLDGAIGPTPVNGMVYVGSLDEAFPILGSGTAVLAGGATDSVNLVNIGQDSTMTVTGAGSSLFVGDGVVGQLVSLAGASLLQIEAGGQVDAQVAIFDGAGSSLQVDGAGSRLLLTCTGHDCELGQSVVLAHQGEGSVQVTNGGKILIDGGDKSVFLGVGLLLGADLQVDGEGSSVEISGGRDDALLKGIVVASLSGSSDISSMSITGGGQVRAAGPDMGATVAYNGLIGFPPGTGSILVDGGGSLLEIGGLLGLGDDPTFDGPGGAGTLIVRNGGTVRADLIYIDERSTASGSGGTLEGAVEVHGTLTPGESPGTMTINGDLNLAPGGRIVIEIGGTGAGTDYDVLNVTGTANLAGTLEIQLLDGYTPGENDTFDFLTAALFAGDFDEYVMPTFGGRTFAVSFGAEGLKATVVPVPAALPLFAFGLAGLGAWRRRCVNAARC